MTWTEPPVKRAYPCNGELIQHLREQRGWTQKELAGATGYSERLVSKAEAGHSLSTASINDLADSLSTDEQPVYPEDLICDPVTFAKEYIAALYIQKMNMFQAIRHFLDEEIVFLLAGDPAVLPFAGEHRGLEAVERLCCLFHTVMEVPEGHNHEPHYSYVTQGNEVIVCGESWMHPVGVPMEKPIRIFNRMRFRRGKLYLFEDIYDTLAGAELFKSIAR